MTNTKEKDTGALYTSTLARLADELRRRGCSCVILTADQQIVCGDERGVRDLLNILDNDPATLDGALIADKVVGKGAAAIMVAGHVSALHTAVISRPALALIHDNNIYVEYDVLAENIINRSGTGICPVEKLTAECATAADCIPLIRNFVANNN